MKALFLTFALLVGYMGDSAKANGNIFFGTDISPMSECGVSYRFDGGQFVFDRHNYKECTGKLGSSFGSPLNLGQKIGYTYFTDGKIQDAVINITNTTQELVLQNIGKIHTRDQQISAMNDSMDHTLSSFRKSFEREAQKAKEYTGHWDNLRHHFAQQSTDHLVGIGARFEARLEQVKEKQSTLELNNRDYPALHDQSNFSRYLKVSDLYAGLSQVHEADRIHSGLSLARSIYPDDATFKAPRFVQLEQEYIKSRDLGILDSEKEILFEAARKFYDSQDQRKYAYDVLDHLSAQRLAQVDTNLRDLHEHLSDDLASRIIDFEENHSKVQTKIGHAQHLIDSHHRFSHPDEVVRRAVEFSKFAASEANESFYRHSMEEGEVLVDMATSTLDFVTGLTPVISTAKDFYELTTGRNFFTDQELSKTDLVFAAIGVATLGFGRPIGSVIKGAVNLSKRLGRTVAPSIHHISDLSKEAMLEFSRSVNRLGISNIEEISQARRFLRNSLGSKIDQPGLIEDVLAQVGRENLASYSSALNELARKGILLTKHTDTYLANQARYGKEILAKGENFSQADFVRMAQSYESLLKNFDRVKGVSFNERVWRAVPDRYSDDIWNITDHTRRANHRYSQPGDSALYTSLGNEDLGRRTIMAELRRQDLNGYHFASKMRAFDNVLDLTNPRVLEKLGVSTERIKRTSDGNFYELTQQIGNIARIKGYKAIKAPSARTRGFDGINFIIFGD